MDAAQKERAHVIHVSIELLQKEGSAFSVKRDPPQWEYAGFA